MIRVLIADDHPIVRFGCAEIIRTSHELELVAQASTPTGAVELAARLVVDVVVLGIRYRKDEPDGLDAALAIHEIRPSVKILVFSAFSEPALVKRALESGVSGYIIKGSPVASLIGAIRAVCAGQTVYPPELLDSMFGSTALSRLDLSNKEREVIQLVADGMSNEAIAEHLSVSVSGIQLHLTHSFEKLHVTNRTAAVVESVKLGLVEIG